MQYTFQPSLPTDYNGQSVLISGKDSLKYGGVEYIVVNEDEKQQVFEIRYEFHTGPFKEILLVDGILAVGFEEFFYLFNTITNELLLKLKMEFYFGNLHYHENLFYVADACHLFCIMKSGDIIWKSDDLAIDGVIIDKFTKDKIYGKGEHDPPGGWIDFILDKMTGKVLKK
ncbi:MAG: hypothetical protein DI539_08935 [Flavobacterium psychrophilum]|nr:MAG: hypothetical protein DI539_08935 [Flavobacterium psychrophilum]